MTKNNKKNSPHDIHLKGLEFGRALANDKDQLPLCYELIDASCELPDSNLFGELLLGGTGDLPLKLSSLSARDSCLFFHGVSAGIVTQLRATAALGATPGFAEIDAPDLKETALAIQLAVRTFGIDAFKPLVTIGDTDEILLFCLDAERWWEEESFRRRVRQVALKCGWEATFREDERLQLTPKPRTCVHCNGLTDDLDED